MTSRWNSQRATTRLVCSNSSHSNSDVGLLADQALDQRAAAGALDVRAVVVAEVGRGCR